MRNPAAQTPRLPYFVRNSGSREESLAQLRFAFSPATELDA